MNEAAERLLTGLAQIQDDANLDTIMMAHAEDVARSQNAYASEQVKLVNAALAAERRATVERVKHEVLFQRTRLGTPPEKIRVTDLLAILDAESER